MEPLTQIATRTEVVNKEMYAYRSATSNSTTSITPSMPPPKVAETILKEVRQLKDVVRQEDTENVLSVFFMTINNMQNYLDNIPKVFQVLFEDIKENLAKH